MFGLKDNEQIYLRGYSDGFNNNHLNSTPRFIGPAFNLISDSEAATVIKEFEIADTFESADSYDVGFNNSSFIEAVKENISIKYNSIDGKTVNIDLSKALVPERTGLFDDGFMIISFKHNGKTYEFDYRNEMGYPVAAGTVLDEKIGVVKSPTEWSSYGVDKEEIISTYYGKTLELSGAVYVNPEKAWKNKVFTFENVSDESYLINLNNLMNDTSHKIFNIACTLDEATGLGSFTPYDGTNDYKLTVNFIGITEDDLITKNLIDTLNTMREYPGITVNFLPNYILPPAEEADLNWEFTTDDETNTITLTKYIGTSEDVIVQNRYSVEGKTYRKVHLYQTGESTSSAFGAFVSNKNIKTVYISEGVHIGSNMNFMFYGCSSLQSIDLRGLDMPNVISIALMFYGCSSLQSIDLSVFKTHNITAISSMFYGCSSLTS